MSSRPPRRTPQQREASRSDKAVLDIDDLTPGQRARRERIVSAGLELLRDYDLDAIQVRDVAEHAGVAVSTVYRYFASKDHLFAAVFLAWQSSMRSSAPIVNARPDQAAEWLARNARLAIRAFELHPHFYKALVMITRSTDPHVRDIGALTTLDSERIFAAPLVGLAPDDRAAIVSVIGATLHVEIGSWLAGRKPISAVYESMNRIIHVLRLSPQQVDDDPGTAANPTTT
jgi:AcrR family transcriptional regulator